MTNRARAIWLSSALCCVALAARAGDLQSPKEITFRAANDGSEQRYMELLPVDFDPSMPHDLIIGLHGHASDRRQFAVDARAECAAFRAFAGRHGMIAITPDYRGTTSWMGPRAEEDVVQLIADVKLKYTIRRVFLAGGSMGGSAALTFAVLHPDLVDGVTAMNPLANHLDYERFQPFIVESFGGDKHTVPDEYRKRSAEFAAEKLTMPVAITVGGKDDVVPPGSARRLAVALQRLNRPVMLIDRADVGHTTRMEDAMAALEFMLERSGKGRASKARRPDRR